MKSSSAYRNSIILLTLLAFLLRAYRLAGQSYWIDEAWTLFYAHLSLPELLENLRKIRAAPPLYHLLTIYWVQLLGDSEYALRFLSLLSSVVAVPLMYRFGKTLAGRRLGLIAALLLAIAPYQIWHAQDARNYSMLTAASLVSMWSFIKLWRRGGWRWWLLYLLGTEWAIMTHYHGLVLIGIQGLFFLLTWRHHWRYYLPWAGSLALILLPVGLWLTLGSTLWQSEHWLPFVPLGQSYLRSILAYSVGEMVPRPQALIWSLPFLLLYGLGLIYAARRAWGPWSGPEMMTFLLIFSLAPNLAIWLYSQVSSPIYLERYLIAVQIGYLVTVAFGILGLVKISGWISQKKQRPWLPRLVASAGLLLLVGISGLVLRHHYSDPVYAKENWRGVIELIEQNSLPGDAILMTGDGGEKLFAHYYHGDLPVYYDFNTPVPPPEQAIKRMADIVAGHRRLWYTPYGVDIDVTLEPWLAEHAYPAWQNWLGRKQLALYDLRAETERLETPATIFADHEGRGPVLDRVALPAQAVAAGDLLPLILTWHTDSPLTSAYHLSLRLTNPQGDVFAQSDWPPLTASQPTSAWSPGQAITDRRSLWLPADLPPGEYQLQLVVYDPHRGNALGQPLVIPSLQISPAAVTPPPESLAIPNFERREMGGLTLLGYAAPEMIQPGQEMWLWLYWLAEQPLTTDPTLRLGLTGDEGQNSLSEQPLSQALGNLADWQPGQVRRAVYHLPTRPGLAGRRATLQVALLTATGQVAAEVDLTDLVLDSRERSFERPTMQHSLAAILGQPPRVTLLGYDLVQADVAPGATLPLTLYWQAEEELDTNYTVFIQLLNPAQQVVAQVDRPPQAGAAPTTTWLPPEIVADPYDLALPENLPPGDYHLIAGLYDAATGLRLSVNETADFVEITTIRVQ